MNSARKIGPKEHSPEVWLTKLQNLTTGTDLLNFKSGGPYTKVSSISEKGFQILLPPGACPVGHIVMIDFTMLLGNTKHMMESTGKVTKVEKSGAENIIEVEFKKFDKPLWNQLLTLLSDRQAHVNKIFSLVKGE
jgi:hypothetical protein